MSRATVLLCALLLLAGSAVIGWYARERLAPAPRLPVLDTLGGAFTLPDSAGRTTALADFRGRLVLLSFGFTSCPDVCPTVLTRMHALLHDLGPEARAVQPLFVTLDPQRDTPERLGAYVRHFGPAFVALRGSEQDTRAVAALFKVHYERVPLPEPLGYGFMHSDQIYLLDRAGSVRATFGNGTRAAQMLATVRSLLAEPYAAAQGTGR